MATPSSISPTSQAPLDSKTVFTGNILLFYAFDVGDDIDLNKIKSTHLLATHVTPLPAYFKNYHTPLSFGLAECYSKSQESPERSDCVSSKIHHFGVLSFCYKIPFQESFESLKQKLIDIEQAYDKQSEEDSRMVFKAINPAIQKPCFYNLKNSYFAVQVNPVADKMEPEDFKERYGRKIVSLLRLETQNLSDYQTDDVLESVTGYYGQDLIIIDTEASFIYDDDYFEAMEFFEFANIQKLELQYFDRLLDQKLNFFYSQKSYKIPFRAYIPFAGGQEELPVYSLAKLRVDISVITERLENSIKMAGDAYYENLYSMLVDQLSLRAWKESINRKMDIIKDLYSVHHDNLTTVRAEIMTIVVIALIAFEVIVLFVH